MNVAQSCEEDDRDHTGPAHEQLVLWKQHMHNKQKPRARAPSPPFVSPFEENLAACVIIHLSHIVPSSVIVLRVKKTVCVITSSVLIVKAIIAATRCLHIYIPPNAGQLFDFFKYFVRLNCCDYVVQRNVR
jgi:hypothetical protein